MNKSHIAAIKRDYGSGCGKVIDTNIYLIETDTGKLLIEKELTSDHPFPQQSISQEADILSVHEQNGLPAPRLKARTPTSLQMTFSGVSTATLIQLFEHMEVTESDYASLAVAVIDLASVYAEKNTYNLDFGLRNTCLSLSEGMTGYIQYRKTEGIDHTHTFVSQIVPSKPAWMAYSQPSLPTEVKIILRADQENLSHWLQHNQRINRFEELTTHKNSEEIFASYHAEQQLYNAIYKERTINIDLALQVPIGYEFLNLLVEAKNPAAVKFLSATKHIFARLKSNQPSDRYPNLASARAAIMDQFTVLEESTVQLALTPTDLVAEQENSAPISSAATSPHITTPLRSNAKMLLPVKTIWKKVVVGSCVVAMLLIAVLNSLEVPMTPEKIKQLANLHRIDLLELKLVSTNINVKKEALTELLAISKNNQEQADIRKRAEQIIRSRFQKDLARILPKFADYGALVRGISRDHLTANDTEHIFQINMYADAGFAPALEWETLLVKIIESG